MQIAIAKRRPIRSAIVPSKIAPNIMPNSAELTMKPAFVASTPMLLHDRRQRDAGDREVVAIEDDDQRAPEQHEPVEAVEAGFVGQLVHIDLTHCSSPSF